MALVIVSGGEYNGHQFEVEGGRLTIGRSIDCDVILRNKDVSSRHAQILTRDKVCWLQDLGSLNGTVYRKRKIVHQALAANDEFSIGEYRFVLADSADAFAEKMETTMDDLRRMLHERLIQELNLRSLTLERLADKALRQRASDALDTLITAHRRQIPPQYDRHELKKAVLDAALGLGPLEDLLTDESISEIMVNGPQQIYVERHVAGRSRLEKSPKTFLTKNEILHTIERIVGPIGRRIDESSPTVDARLADGSRVHAIIHPLALDSPTITIRKFPKIPMKVADWIDRGSLTAAMAAFLQACVLAKRNIIISGGTGTGKTTMLNVLGAYIPDGERVITIEDSAELRLPQEHVVRLETRPPNIEGAGAVPIRELVRNALRMRPNRIVVGECRGTESVDMLQAMNTGHDGSLTTLHANTPEDAVRRLENLVLFAGKDLPLNAIRELIFSAVHVIVQISRFPDGTRKVTEIAEMSSMHQGEIRLQPIFRYLRKGIDAAGAILGEHSASGVIPAFIEEQRQFGLGVDMSIFVPTAND
jgi:pilus assembly protein CpaF